MFSDDFLTNIDIQLLSITKLYISGLNIFNAIIKRYDVYSIFYPIWLSYKQMV